MIAARDFIAAARSIVGIPFVHQGHGPHGVDCVGSFWLAAERAGLDVLRFMPLAPGEAAPAWNYSREPQALALDRMRRWARPIPDPIPGCLIFFRLPRCEHPSHFAIYTGASIIHALATEGRVVEQGYGRPWTRWTHSRWALPGVAYG